MATPSKSVGQRMRFWLTARRPQAVRKQDKRGRPRLEVLEDRALPSINPVIGDVIYIDMENHNLTQPTGLNPPPGQPEQLLGNPAAPYLNSLMTPGNPNAAQTSYASKYYNVEYNNPAVSIHPSEPNYIWQEAGIASTNPTQPPYNDADPYANTPNNIVNAPSLSALLQSAGISWKSYQEDTDLTPPTGGSVNQPSTWPNANLSSTVAPQSQWTVPTSSFSGTSTVYTNPYNGSHQYNFAVKHDGTLFFTATNGGTSTAPNFDPSNPEAQYYAPLQQFQTDLDNNTLARYSVITPNQFNDMHSSLKTDFSYNGTTWTHGTDQESIAIGDNFLSQIVPKIMASQAYKNNGVLVIWFDETENGNSTSFTIPEIVISPLARGNAYNSTLAYTHSSDLKSLQELFGVSAPGGGFLGDANTPGTNDLSDLFVPGVFTPSAIGGIVFKNSGNDGKVVGGLTIVLTGVNDANQVIYLTTTTAADGSYSFTGLLPGTYSVTVLGSKKDVGISNISLGVDESLFAEDFSLLGPDSHK
jgi:hypothetical protein